MATSGGGCGFDFYISDISVILESAVKRISLKSHQEKHGSSERAKSEKECEGVELSPEEI